MPRHKIFISYRREGGKTIADKLYAAFEKNPRQSMFEVFQDVRNLERGGFWPQLRDGIEHCDTFLLILSPGALDERMDQQLDYFRMEIECAVAHNKVIIPITMAGFKPPEKMTDEITKAIGFEGVDVKDPGMFLEESIIDKICRLIGKPSAYVDRSAQFLKIGIEDRWKDAEEISILAIGLRSVYESYINTIEEKYNEGTRFRFLTVSHKGHSRKDTETTKIFSKGGKNYLKNQTKMLSDAIALAHSKYPDAQGLLEYRTFEEHITCTIQIVKRRNIEKSYIFVEFWPIVARDCDRDEMPSACFQYGSPYFSYYEDIFEKIWARARRIK